MRAADTIDVCVAGFGVWGASAARALGLRGFRVLAVDPRRPPHEHGSHTGRTRLARRSAHEGAGYTPITARAFELWDDIEREHGAQLLRRTGALLLDRPDGGLIAPSRATLRDGGWDYEELDARATRERWPGLSLRDDEACIHEPGAMTVDAPRAVEALGASARLAGAQVLTGQAVEGWRRHRGGGVEVALSGARPVRCSRLVLAVGNRAPELSKTGWPLEVERQVLITYELPDRLTGLPAVFAVDERLGPRSGFYGCPELDGTYKVALHHEGQTGPPDLLEPRVTDEDLRRITEVVARRIPDLAGEVLEAKTCTYTNTPDHDWVLDQHPDDPAVVVASGDSGRGFRFAPAIGELVADLIADGPGAVPAFLRSERFDRA